MPADFIPSHERLASMIARLNAKGSSSSAEENFDEDSATAPPEASVEPEPPDEPEDPAED